jgi:trehalose 6-phosphate synthase
MNLDVISYRGPGNAGGVSSGLESIWRQQQNFSSSTWWFLGKRFLEKLSAEYKNSNFVTMLPEHVVKGHYRYCNEFLWPVLHDLPEHAIYNPDDQDLYRQFNLIFANYIGYEFQSGKHYFVQDYQLALLPRFVSIVGARSLVFWHIPWPANVLPDFVQPLVEIARGLLRADSLGFHTSEYAHNFIRFVWQYLPDYTANSNSMYIHALNLTSDSEIAKHFEENNYMTTRNIRSKSNVLTTLHGTQIIIHPLGIDTNAWEIFAATKDSNIANKLEQFTKLPFILSVDRTDYTKSVYERLQMVDQFFEKNPNYREQLKFIQVCGKTRPGLTAFDNYWSKSRALYEQITARWQTANWQPIVWLDEPLSAAELSFLYQEAMAMLVNPVRDGLNLTAKEFVACQKDDRPGVLLLSEGAGAWHELGAYALSASPNDQEKTIKHILQAVNMPFNERKLRMELMKEKLHANNISDWWSHLTRISRIPSHAYVASDTRKFA